MENNMERGLNGAPAKSAILWGKEEQTRQVSLRVCAEVRIAGSATT